MTATRPTTQSQPGTLTFEYDLKHAPAKVWRALTEPALLAQWLLPVLDLELAPGTTFTFQTDPQPNWDGIVNCRFMEIEPHRKLSYSWVVGDIDTVVTFILTPTPNGTRLSLMQSGFKPTQKQNLAGARYGWNMMSQNLIELLDQLP